MKLKEKIIKGLSTIIFSPIILLFCVMFFLSMPFTRSKNKSAYKKSPYYKNFKKPFSNKIFYSFGYAFYNSAAERGLPCEYVSRMPLKPDYFIYNDAVYVFPERGGKIVYDREKKRYEFTYEKKRRGKPCELSEYVRKISADVRVSAKSGVMLLAERSAFAANDLNLNTLPEFVCLTRTYETAFSDECDNLKTASPRNVEELMDMIKQTPDLCGRFDVGQDGHIKWLLGNVTVDINAEENRAAEADSENYENGSLETSFFLRITENGSADGKAFQSYDIFDNYDIYDEIVKLGKKGNITVYRSKAGSVCQIYSGPTDQCPHQADNKDKKLFFIVPETASTLADSAIN